MSLPDPPDDTQDPLTNAIRQFADQLTNAMESLPHGGLLNTTNPLFDLPSLVAETLCLQDTNDFEDNFNGNLDEVLNLSPLSTPPSSPTLAPVTASEDSINSININIETSGPPSSLGSPLKALKAPHKNSKNATSSKKKPSRNTASHRKATRNAAASKSRFKKRAAEKQEIVNPYFVPRPRTVERYITNAKKIQCGIEMRKLPMANGAHVGLDNRSGNRRTYTLEDLVGEGSRFNFRLQEWDGEKSFALVDNEQHVIGVLAGHPDDDEWPALLEEATKALESKRPLCHVSKEEKKRAPRRGKFVALRCGVSHGGGQKKPGNLRNVPANEEVLNELNKLGAFQRLTGFTSSVMATWCPKLYDHYKTNVEALHAHHPELVRVFPSSVHSGFSYNLGHQTVCYKHTDFGNYAVGACGVTPLGDYDYKKGGHLVLWDLKTVVEFPPGSTILLPSAIIAHSNVAIQKGETRYSFAQYTAGALFRWVDNGFQTREEYLSNLTPEQLVADQKKQEGRLEHALSLLRVLP